jgi:antigen flippase
MLLRSHYQLDCRHFSAFRYMGSLRMRYFVKSPPSQILLNRQSESRSKRNALQREGYDQIESGSCSSQSETSVSSWDRLTSKLPLRSFASTGASNFGMALFGALASLISARLLGPTGRGELAAAFAWMFVLSAVSQVGIPQALSYTSSKTPSCSRAFFRYASRSLIWQGTLVLPAVTVYLLHGHLLTSGTRDCILLALPAVLFTTVSTYAHSVALGNKQYRLFNTIRLMVAFSYLLALIAAYLLGCVFPRAVIALFVLLQGLVALYSVSAICKSYEWEDIPLSNLQKTAFKGYSLKASLGNFSSLMNLRIDQFIISLLLATSQLGFYAVAVGYAGILTPIAGAFANVSLSMVAAHGAESTQYSAKRTIALSLVCTLVPGVVLWWGAPVGIPFIFGKSFVAAVPVARVLCLAGIPLGLGYVLSDIIRGLGKPEYVAGAEFLGSIVTVAGLFVFLPKAGILAAGWVSMASYITVLTVSISGYRMLRSSSFAHA